MKIRFPRLPRLDTDLSAADARATSRDRFCGLSLLSAAFLLCAVEGCGGGDGGSAGDTGGTSGVKRASGGGARLAYQSARNFLDSNDLDEAEKELRRAIELDDDYTEAHFELGQLLVRLSYVIVGSGSRDQEKLDEGIKHLRRAFELDPKNDAFAYWIGRAAHIGEDLATARTFLGQSLALNAKNGLAHKRMGLLLMDESDLEGACSSFETAMELLPEDGGLRFQYGNTLENVDQREKAILAYEAAIEVDPTMPAPYNRLATLREASGDTEGAAEALRQFNIWKRWDQELQAAQKKVQRRPDDPQTLFFLGEQYFAAGKFRESLSWFTRVINLDRRHAHAHLYCGIARRELGDLNFSVDHLEEAAFLSPDSLEPKIELIRTCTRADKTARVEEVIKQIEEEAPDDPFALFELGKICAEVKRTDEAKRLFGRVVELDPTHEEVKLALAKLSGAGG